MNSTTLDTLRTATVLVLLTSGPLAARQEQPVASTHAPAAPLAGVSDRPLAPYQEKLLDVAFQAVSGMPTFPHVKNRSRAQETVLEAYLELGQPHEALARAEQVTNWRRGDFYGDLAIYLAKNGAASEVPHFAELALGIADDLRLRLANAALDDSIDTPQDWQCDSIRVKVGQAHAWIGEGERAAELEGGVVDSEFGKVSAVHALLAPAESFDQEVAALDAVATNAELDRIRNVLDGYAGLFDRFYADAVRRDSLEKRIRAAWDKTPRQVRSDVLSELADAAVRHGDQEKARALLAETRALFVDAPGYPEDLLPVLARLPALRFRAGETKEARSDLDAVFGRFDAQQGEIPDVYRAGVLRALAETYVEIGDRTTATTAYRRAIEAGALNPNARPRAEDLAETCCSMARAGIEPDETLWARIASIRAGLREPW